MSKPLIVANWKMNPATFRAAKKLLEVTRKAAMSATGATLVVAPPTVFLRELRAGYKGKRLFFAAQDVSSEPGGAHTGELSILQAKDAGAAYCIIGHSERRAGGETNDDTRKAIVAALEARITPILCIGERARGNTGEHLEFVKEQLQTGFADVPQSKVGKVIVAYEPVWAIGGEEAMKPRDMHEMAIFIRKTLVGLHGDGARSFKILYGGAATEGNATDMLRHGDVDGLLVGHVSVDPERFEALFKAVSGKV
ncbi:triosephosphate isomerase [Candidatus Kaiserbacteria bacterium]|nr:triosephosphate isomerase [Candidatus Kaiserbacteria bacterium]